MDKPSLSTHFYLRHIHALQHKLGSLTIQILTNTQDGKFLTTLGLYSKFFGGTLCVFRTFMLHLCFILALAGLSINSSYIIAGKNVPGNSSCMAIVFLWYKITVSWNANIQLNSRFVSSYIHKRTVNSKCRKTKISNGKTFGHNKD